MPCLTGPVAAPTALPWKVMDEKPLTRRLMYHAQWVGLPHNTRSSLTSRVTCQTASNILKKACVKSPIKALALVHYLMKQSSRVLYLITWVNLTVKAGHGNWQINPQGKVFMQKIRSASSWVSMAWF